MIHKVKAVSHIRVGSRVKAIVVESPVGFSMDGDDPRKALGVAISVDHRLYMVRGVVADGKQRIKPGERMAVIVSGKG